MISKEGKTRAEFCNELFLWCCARDDKMRYQMGWKFEEEKGEFFRELLIWDGHKTGVQCLTNRTTSLDTIYREMIDCLICLNRMKGRPGFDYIQSIPEKTPQEFGRFASMLKMEARAEIFVEICTIIEEDMYYTILEEKLTKWATILVEAGLEDKPRSDFYPPMNL